MEYKVVERVLGGGYNVMPPGKHEISATLRYAHISSYDDDDEWNFRQILFNKGGWWRQAIKSEIIYNGVQGGQNSAHKSQELAQIVQKILYLKTIQEEMKKPNIMSLIIQAET